MAIIEICPNFVSYGESMNGAMDEWDAFIMGTPHFTFKVEDLDTVLSAVSPYLEVFNLAQWPDVDQRLFEAFEGKTFPNVKWFRIGYDECQTYRSFDITPEGLSCLLKAFPNLEHLEVPLSTECYFDVEDLFKAPFAETLAYSCPRLRRLQLNNMVHGPSVDLPFNDNDFAYFAQMSQLEDIELAPVDSSVEAIFTLGQTPPGYQKTRVLQLGRLFGEAPQVSAEVAADFVDLLANTDADKLKSLRFHVILSVSDDGNGEEDIAAVGAAMARLRTAHLTKDIDADQLSEDDPPVEEQVLVLAHWEERSGLLTVASRGIVFRRRYDSLDEDCP
ncbi:hypothetical protein HDU86_007495 [Geranomyces michiganensis]|nr:hypothetical protein HDU86_007495 [Geranomyces michiganensis]